MRDPIGKRGRTLRHLEQTIEDLIGVVWRWQPPDTLFSPVCG
jgi:hypothetical protein